MNKGATYTKIDGVWQQTSGDPEDRVVSGCFATMAMFHEGTKCVARTPDGIVRKVWKTFDAWPTNRLRWYRVDRYDRIGSVIVWLGSTWPDGSTVQMWHAEADDAV